MSDSSAPINLTLDAAGKVVPVRVPQVVAAIASSGDTIGAGQTGDVFGTGVTIAAADYDRVFFGIATYDIRALGGAGFSVQTVGFFSTSTHSFSAQAQAVMVYIPGTVADSDRQTVAGLAVSSVIPAGQAFEVHTKVTNIGSATIVVDVNSGWVGVLAPA